MYDRNALRDPSKLSLQVQRLSVFNRTFDKEKYNFYMKLYMKITSIETT